MKINWQWKVPIYLFGYGLLLLQFPDGVDAAVALVVGGAFGIILGLGLNIK